MTPTLVSFATIFTLLNPGAGLVANVAAVAIQPTVDVAATQLPGIQLEGPVGGDAARIEFDDADLDASTSAWYRLAYVEGGTRLRVFEHYAVTIEHPDLVLLRSETMAWSLANEVVGTNDGAATDDRVPGWAIIHTGGDTGPSAGLMFTLAYLDMLTPGRLVGDLRVAGTGLIGLDGVVGPVSEIEVKVAAARLTRPDVIFAPREPESIEHLTVVESHHTRHPSDGYTVGEWLNVAGFEQAGRAAASRAGTTAIVVVHDLRQALAWLCGRTGSATTCELARNAAAIPIW